MANEKAKSDYKHWVGAVPKIENWYKNFNFVLVESMEDLESIFKDKKDYYMAFDTETTGLDFEEIDLVGYSFCLDGKTAYYVPVYHFQYDGNLGEESVKFIYERMCEAKKVFMYNMRYDARIMEYYGYKENKADLDKRRWMYAKFDMSKVDYYDVSVPVWLADTNQKYPSLKWSSLHFLGIEQLHFDEVIENAGSFFYLNPSENEDTVFYAAADALCTFLLATATVKYFTEAKHSAKFDNLMLYPLLHYENERIWLDGDVLKNLYITATDRVDKMERDVYAMIGGQINLNSPVQVAQAFERLGIDTGERTSKGTMSVGIKILADLPKEYVEKFPALKSYINYKKTAKLISSYIKPLLKEYERRGYCRFAYKTTEVPTGRLASGKDGKNSFFSPINAQCVVGSSELFTDRGVKTIKDISVGDNVWDGESFREVLNTYNNGIQDVYKVTLCDGKTLICTDKHQLYSSVVFSAFRELKDLNVGDSVAININSVDIGFSSNSLNTRNSLDFDNVVGWVKIKSIEYVGKEEVYDIHVDVTHRYCVNGFITHNSLPKPHVKMEDVFDLGDRNLFSKKDNIIMGYKFVYSSYDEEGKHIIPDDPAYIGWVEGMDDDLNIRMAISPKMLEDSNDDEFLYTSFDYAAEELRIAANLSREPNWVDAFVHGDDIHKRCYSLDTEFLTRDGWKTYEHIGIDTEIAQYNEDTKELEFVKAGHAYFNETDTMYHFVGNNTDLLVTPNHRMYDKGRDNWYVKRADELYKKRYYHTICSPISNKVLRDSGIVIDRGNIDIKSTYHKDGFSISVDDFVELLGYVITDGGTCLRSCGTKTVYFSQSEVKADVLARMQDLNRRLGGLFKEEIDYCKGKETTICGRVSILNGNFHRFSLTSSALFDVVVEYIGGNLKKDRVLSNKMLQFSDRLLIKFLDAMYDGDGLHDNREGRENSRTLLVQSKKLVEQLQLILINIGYSTNIRDVSDRYSTNLYKLNYVKDRRVVRGSNRKTEIIKYDEPVKSVCFAVPSTLLFVRRNGKTSVCGNTAVAIWGEEHYNRDYRKMAKYANFSILYGASSHSLYADSRYGFKSLQEAEDFYNKYKKALPTLFQWQDRLIYSARRKGMLQTFFGRPRRLRSYYENKQIGFANRSAGNTSVQGVAGDILKMVMIKLWRALFNNDEFKNDVAWRVAIHDEIGYTIRATKLMRILKIIKETQSVKLPEWPVEIITDPSVGWSMGRVYDFHMVEDDSELGYHFEPDLA
jgi:DNA polymerase I-like protein with 3'-5' exonuclease and polymerase domains